MNIGKSLQEHRERNGLSQTALAQKTGIKQQTISRWEADITVPKITDCITLALFYGISVDYLIGLENEDGTKMYDKRV
ncbi:MAG: helix-turn-helix transcriptional regulator [Clostridia bacterium]|jgi:transcriptional regulator with XRE-family HTH domain|nr:helix-turn-helix transcriptional regulator [Clostridia bacterium]